MPFVTEIWSCTDEWKDRQMNNVKSISPNFSAEKWWIKRNILSIVCFYKELFYCIWTYIFCLKFKQLVINVGIANLKRRYMYLLFVTRSDWSDTIWLRHIMTQSVVLLMYLTWSVRCMSFFVCLIEAHNDTKCCTVDVLNMVCQVHVILCIFDWVSLWHKVLYCWCT